MSRAALLDVDGTLIDSNYQHAIAWYRAFRDHDITLPVWRLHRHIGMGGDQLVTAVAGSAIEDAHGDSLRASESRHFGRMIDEVRPLSGAHELLVALMERGWTAVLASSAKQEDVERYLSLLEAHDLVAGYTTSDDVEATKPEPDLVAAAKGRANSDQAVMVGDSTWDIEAAQRAGIETVAVLTGGFSAAELREAGAVCVFSSLDELGRELDSTPLR